MNTFDNTSEIVGGFTINRDEDFKQGLSLLCESVQNQHLDLFQDISMILKNPTTRAAYKEGLLGDVVRESFDDAYYGTHVAKLDQLFENSAMEILRESSVGQVAPIVGTSLPILKKEYLECVSKDIVMTEVPKTPIVKKTFERKFLKDRDGNKYYIPEIFYNDDYKNIMSKAKGAAFPEAFLPDATDIAAGITFPLQDYDLIGKVGGTLQKRDSIALDVRVCAVQTEVDGETIEVPVNAVPDVANNGVIYTEVIITKADKTTVTDMLFGKVDFYSGKVSVTSSNGYVKGVKFAGNLSNQNNTNGLEIDFEREVKTYMIGEGETFNSGLTVNKIKDMKALLDIDMAATVVTDMAQVVTQTKDSNIIAFVRDSYNAWKAKKNLPYGYTGGFTEESVFSCIPSQPTTVPGSVWLNTELKFHISRHIDRLKTKLKEKDMMFVIAGHPNHITLLNDSVNWVVDTETKLGGVQLSYNFGVLTDSKDRAHVVSTEKIPESEGILIVAYPLTDNTMTFKNYDYSFTVENSYRNPNTPLTPNIMVSSRNITVELLPVQGRFLLTDNEFGITGK